MPVIITSIIYQIRHLLFQNRKTTIKHSEVKHILYRTESLMKIQPNGPVTDREWPNRVSMIGMKL